MTTETPLVLPTIANPTWDLLVAQGRIISNGCQALYVRRAALEGNDRNLVIGPGKAAVQTVLGWAQRADQAAPAAPRVDLMRLAQRLRRERRMCETCNGTSKVVGGMSADCPDCYYSPGAGGVFLDLAGVPVSVSVLLQALRGILGRARVVALDVQPEDCRPERVPNPKVLALVTDHWVLFQMQVNPEGMHLAGVYEDWLSNREPAELLRNLLELPAEVPAPAAEPPRESLVGLVGALVGSCEEVILRVHTAPETGGRAAMDQMALALQAVRSALP